MSSFMGKDLPLRFGLDNDIGGRNRLVLSAGSLIAGAGPAKHASPGQANGCVRGTGCEEGPVGILIFGFAAPLGKRV